MIYNKNILTKDSLKNIYLKSVGAEGCQIVHVSFVALFSAFCLLCFTCSTFDAADVSLLDLCKQF